MRRGVQFASSVAPMVSRFFTLVCLRFSRVATTLDNALTRADPPVPSHPIAFCAMQFAVFNPDSGKYLGRYDASCIRSAKFLMYEDAGYDPHEVTEEMLSSVDASPVPLSDNEDRMNAR